MDRKASVRLDLDLDQETGWRVTITEQDQRGRRRVLVYQELVGCDRLEELRADVHEAVDGFLARL
jgi:hypothetical protein